jgi:Ni/Co efflux regulator RcnB
MKAKSILCSLVIASIGMGSVSFAHEDHGRGHEDHGRGHDDHGRGHEMRHEERDEHHERRDERREMREERHFYNARGGEFHRGGRLPPELRHRQYVVSNWRAYRLAPPPRGYQWVQVGPDFVLAAIATGIIVNLIVSR